MSRIAVRHFGPDPSEVGGMASVIRVLTENNVGAEAVRCTPTWSARSRRESLRLSACAARRLLTMQRGQVAHFHLSERGSFIREGALVALARACNLVTVVTIHGASFIPFARRYPWLVAGVLRRTSLVTCLDREVAGFVREAVPQVPCELLPNPIRVDSDVPRADETEELVLFAGEIGLRKGADVLRDAWLLVCERRPAARCVLIGPSGDFVPPPAERLEIREPVESDRIREMMLEARVVALPSRAEGMPMILTEAMSVGRPFVSTPVGGIPELAVAGGMLVPVEDEVRLAECLIELLASPARAREIGDQGHSFCARTRSVEVIDMRMRELYRSAASRASPAPMPQ